MYSRASSFFSEKLTLTDNSLRFTGSLWYWPVATVALWVLFAACLNTGQFGDNIEQLNWAHSFEWGYYKHPPLPTWLLRLFTLALGQSPYTTYLLGFMCLAATGFLTHRIAHRLLGLPIANFAMVLWSLQIPFNWRAQVYNHNTLLVLSVALTAWCLLNALSHGQRKWWLATGFAAGLALLSKYQAVVPLAGMLLALVWLGQHKKPSTRQGLLIAALITVVVMSPHLSWLIEHDFQTLAYASSHDQRLDLVNRNMGVIGFFINQLRFMLPALICIVIVSLIKTPQTHSQPSQASQATADLHDPKTTSIWMFGLLGFPVIVLIIMSLGRGVALQNHWGMQSFQFISLWFAYRLSRNSPSSALPLKSGVMTALVIQLLMMAMYMYAPFATKRHFFDLRFPSQELVRQVDKSWQAQTQCPLRIVSGNAFAAGLYSAYAPQHPVVMEDNSHMKSPWISMQAVQYSGAMYFALKPELLPHDVEHIHSLSVSMDAQDEQTEVVTFHWGMKRPLRSCDTLTAKN
jgi:4-amino-4-deoxy-L-arabinose transferase-like glycosyltransferase